MQTAHTHILGFDSPNKNYFVQLMDQDETYYSILHYNPNWMLLTFLKGTTRLPFGFYKPDQTYISPNKMMEHFPLIICTDVVVPSLSKSSSPAILGVLIWNSSTKKMMTKTLVEMTYVVSQVHLSRCTFVTSGIDIRIRWVILLLLLLGLGSDHMFWKNDQSLWNWTYTYF